MNNALLVAERELRAYARSPLGYVVAAVTLLIEGIYFYAFGLGAKTALLSAQVLALFFEGASGATIGLAAGVALLASGIALVVKAPRGEAARRLVSDVRLTAVPTLKGANLRLVGVWQ